MTFILYFGYFRLECVQFRFSPGLANIYRARYATRFDMPFIKKYPMYKAMRQNVIPLIHMEKYVNM